MTSPMGYTTRKLTYEMLLDAAADTSVPQWMREQFWMEHGAELEIDPEKPLPFGIKALLLKVLTPEGWSLYRAENGRQQHWLREYSDRIDDEAAEQRRRIRQAFYSLSPERKTQEKKYQLQWGIDNTYLEHRERMLEAEKQATEHLNKYAAELFVKYGAG